MLTTAQPQANRLNQDEQEIRAQCPVLVVEDVVPERARLVAMLSKLGYPVWEAGNGDEALQLVKHQPMSLIISDWRMPGMDGMELLSRLKAQAETAPYFILLTGQDALCDLIAALDAGADDFIRKPANGEELRARVQAGERIMRLRDGIECRNRELEQALQRESSLSAQLQADLAAAAELQRSLLPPAQLDVPGVTLAQLFQPAFGVAGDCYNLIRFSDQEIGFYHIDLVGHGVRAAMQSFTLSRMLNEAEQFGFQLSQMNARGEVQPLPPEQVVSQLNQRFQDQSECRNYFTLVYGILNLATGHGRLCQAGHPHPYRQRLDGSLQRLGEGGMPVGIFDEAQYEGQDFELAEGERLMIYSDGLLSCRLSNGAPLDDAALQQIFLRCRQLPLTLVQRQLQRMLEQLLSQHAAEDDISLLVLERTAPDYAGATN